MRQRIAVLHGVNLDQLGVRDPEVYGSQTLTELEVRVKRWAQEIGMDTQFDQTNHEGEFCETLHELRGTVDGLLLNPGAWTHYSYAIRDAIEVAALPAVEVHLSDVHGREPFRRVSVLEGLCGATVAGQGLEGYRTALARLRQVLA